MALARDVRNLLRDGPFRLLYSARCSSQLADGLFQASLAAAVVFNPEHQTNAADLAASFTVVLLPYSLVGPFAGVFLDRWRRQRVLVVANVVRAGLVALTAALIVTRGPTSAAFFTAALLTLSVNRFYLSALSAALPHVVRPGGLVTANSLSTTSGTVATTIGAGAAVLLRHGVGVDDRGSAVIALGSAAVYLLSSYVASRLDVHQLGPADQPHRAPLHAELAVVARGLVDGVRHVAARPRPRAALAAISGHRLFYGISTVATVLVYRNYFGDEGLLRGGLAGLAEVVMAAGVGTVVAAVATPPATARWSKERWMTGCLAGAAVVELALGTPYRQDTFLVAALGLGFVAQSVKICVDTLVQESVEDAYLGRVFAGYDMLFNLTFIVAAVLSASWLPASGKSYPALAVVAAGYALTAVLYATVTRRRLGRLATATATAAEPVPLVP